MEIGYSCTIQYQNLTDSWRKIKGSSDGSSSASHCDRDYSKINGNTWYRFVEPAGTKLSTSAPSKYSCGTDAVGWMDGAHPTRVGQIVSRKMCFSWDSQCSWASLNTNVATCRGYDGQLFYLYQLKKPSNSCLAYCGV